jgi:hypothetical protein
MVALLTTGSPPIVFPVWFRLCRLRLDQTLSARRFCLKLCLIFTGQVIKLKLLLLCGFHRLWVDAKRKLKSSAASQEAEQQR